MQQRGASRHEGVFSWGSYFGAVQGLPGSLSPPGFCCQVGFSSRTGLPTGVRDGADGGFRLGRGFPPELRTLGPYVGGGLLCRGRRQRFYGMRRSFQRASSTPPASTTVLLLLHLTTLGSLYSVFADTQGCTRRLLDIFLPPQVCEDLKLEMLENARMSNPCASSNITYHLSLITHLPFLYFKAASSL